MFSACAGISIPFQYQLVSNTNIHQLLIKSIVIALIATVTITVHFYQSKKNNINLVIVIRQIYTAAIAVVHVRPIQQHNRFEHMIEVIEALVYILITWKKISFLFTHFAPPLYLNCCYKSHYNLIASRNMLWLTAAVCFV